VASVILECIETEEQSMTLPPILVTGGTGTLGQQVVSRLREAGRDVRVLSRRSRTSQDGLVFATGDLATGEGLPAAVHGVGTIVHCASNRKGDVEATRNLVRAAAQEKQEKQGMPGMPGDLPHLVYISIVGVDRFPRGYFKAKLEAEGVITDSGLPWTTARRAAARRAANRGRLALQRVQQRFHPGAEVGRGPGGDEVSVDHRGLVHPVGPRVDHVVADGAHAGGPAALDDLG
jgi:uncharacterized protein YbjT (DUF2867 family)